MKKGLGVKKIRIGTRGSALALWQANWVRSKLESIFPQCEFELMRIKTQGDKLSHIPLEKIDGKGIFVKQIEIALLNGEIDLAVHSMKDLPTDLPDGLIVGAVPERADPADVLISRHGEQRTEQVPQTSRFEQDPVLHHLPRGARIGTSSLRRRSQLLCARDDLVVEDIRGNVDTRLSKLESGDLDAIVLALAGVERLGAMDTREFFAQRLPYSLCLPAVGQGAIGVEIRAEDKDLQSMVKSIDHSESAAAVKAERAFLKRLGGGCRVPIAALGTVDSGELELMGLVAKSNGRRVLRSSTSDRQEEAEHIGEELAEFMLSMGAKSILR